MLTWISKSLTLAASSCRLAILSMSWMQASTGSLTKDAGRWHDQGARMSRDDPPVSSSVAEMRGGAEVVIIEQWKQLALAEPDARRRADYGGLALVFAELTDCRPQWKRALEGWNVEQSQQVLEWQAIAEKRGKTEGKAEGKVEWLLRVLQRRFASAVPAELEAAIRGITEQAKLDPLLDAALAADSLDDFRRTVNL
jgi:hypothetical protein